MKKDDKMLLAVLGIGGAVALGAYFLSKKGGYGGGPGPGGFYGPSGGPFDRDLRGIPDPLRAYHHRAGRDTVAWSEAPHHRRPHLRGKPAIYQAPGRRYQAPGRRFWRRKLYVAFSRGPTAPTVPISAVKHLGTGRRPRTRYVSPHGR